MIQRVIWIGLAGAAGALARFVLSSLIQQKTPGVFPLATFAVNILGCFIYGLAFQLFQSKAHLPPDLRATVLVGFLGAFTTFSSFAFENTMLWRNGNWELFALNIVLQNVLGIALLAAGMHCAKAIAA